MKHAELGMRRFAVILTPPEMARLKEFIRKRGGKMATWTRQLILRELDRYEGHGDGSTQARETAESFKEVQG